MTVRRILIRPGMSTTVTEAQIRFARRHLSRGSAVEVVCPLNGRDWGNHDIALPVLTEFRELIFDAAVAGPIEPADDQLTMLLTPRTPGTEGGAGVRVPRTPAPSSPPEARRLAMSNTR
jgi:translation initiation factor IF-3